VTERLLQGIVNTLVLTRTFAGVCSDIPELRIGRRDALDPADRYFIGISQGSILGTTTASLSLDIERFVLNVGGISFPTMMRRSTNFTVFEVIFTLGYDDKRTRDLIAVMSASLWDAAEPATYASHLLADPLPGTLPFPKRILYQIGRDDAQVPNVASDMAARTIGLPLLSPSAYEPWNVPSAAPPLDSAYVVYDVHAEPQPLGSVPYHDTETHETVRRLDAVQMQMDAFMQPDGQVQSFCDGPCDPE